MYSAVPCIINHKIITQIVKIQEIKYIILITRLDNRKGSLNRSRPEERKMKKSKAKIPRKIRRIMLRPKQQVVTKLVKPVGRNSGNLGRIYLPGNWIGKKVKITLL